MKRVMPVAFVLALVLLGPVDYLPDRVCWWLM
jgi:hypothetical protein